MLVRAWRTVVRLPEVFASVGAVMGLALVAGCGGERFALSPGADVAEQAVAAVDEVMYQTFDGEGLTLVRDAWTAVVGDCMHAQGFDPDAGPSTRISGDFERAAAAAVHDWWGVSEPQFAQQYGYRPVPEDLFVDVEEIPGTPEPPGYFDAFYGSDSDPQSDGGCTGKADDALYAGGPAHEQVVEIQRKVTAEVESAARTGQRVAEVSLRWSECMGEDGYAYVDPHAAFGDFATFAQGGGYAYVTPTAEPQEFRVATADATCKERVGFWDAVADAERAAKVRVMDTMRMEIELVISAHRRAVENAASVLASLGSEEG
ncbi:MAG: hypothetical protein LBK59_11630 [Bifidobacteriaceae bacterium]|nr:hypothetical protein [Bifidobacteriaceae bacterium]